MLSRSETISVLADESAPSSTGSALSVSLASSSWRSRLTVLGEAGVRPTDVDEVAVGVQRVNGGCEVEVEVLVELGVGEVLGRLAVDDEEIVGHVHAEQVRRPLVGLVHLDFVAEAWSCYLGSRPTRPDSPRWTSATRTRWALVRLTEEGGRQIHQGHDQEGQQQDHRQRPFAEQVRVD